MDLATYQQNVRELLNDPDVQFYTTTSLNNWINRARTETAKRTGCVRLLTRSSAPIASIAVSAAGTGYSAATVEISAPDAIGGTYTQATATASVPIIGAGVSSITVTEAGTGYVLTPTVTIDGDGSGATATATLGTRMTTTAGQEVYTFAAATAVLQAVHSGVQAVIGVLDVAVSWGAMKPTLQWMPWSSFQAYARSINQGQSYPSVWSQYALGETGSVYLYPIPSGSYEMQWDCYCTPQALSVSQTVDVIPDNWTQAVFYYACYLAYMNAQRRDDAQMMRALWDSACAEAAQYSQPPRTPTYYPSDD